MFFFFSTVLFFCFAATFETSPLFATVPFPIKTTAPTSTPPFFELRPFFRNIYRCYIRMFCQKLNGC